MLFFESVPRRLPATAQFQVENPAIYMEKQFRKIGTCEILTCHHPHQGKRRFFLLCGSAQLPFYHALPEAFSQCERLRGLQTGR